MLILVLFSITRQFVVVVLSLLLFLPAILQDIRSSALRFNRIDRHWLSKLRAELCCVYAAIFYDSCLFIHVISSAFSAHFFAFHLIALMLVHCVVCHLNMIAGLCVYGERVFMRASVWSLFLKYCEFGPIISFHTSTQTRRKNIWAYRSILRTHTEAQPQSFLR